MNIGGLQRCSFIDYPRHISAVIFTSGCNFRCPYCHNPELVDETADQISEDEVLAFLRSRREKLDAITITGGEPTMHEDLVPFMRKIQEMGFLIKLDTNGTNPHILRQAVEEKLVNYVAMDIKAPLSTYENIAARPVDIRKIEESIAYLLKNNVPYEFRTTVVKALLSRDDLQKIGETIQGAHTYYLQRFVPTKLLNPSFVKKTTYSDEEFLEITDLMKNYVTNCLVR